MKFNYASKTYLLEVKKGEVQIEMVPPSPTQVPVATSTPPSQPTPSPVTAPATTTPEKATTVPLTAGPPAELPKGGGLSIGKASTSTTKPESVGEMYKRDRELRERKRAEEQSLKNKPGKINISQGQVR